jgi:hypothetical protein
VTEQATEAPINRVVWPHTHRLVLSHYPPVSLYDDVADPHDWEALAAAQARTNPRIYDEIGDLSKVPPDRRLSGPGASWVMGAFTHSSPDRPTRFSDGSFGLYYAGAALQTALYEHSFHMGRFYAQSALSPGWMSEVRQLVGALDADLVDLRGDGNAALLDPDDYKAAQEFGTRQNEAGQNGIVYPSVRDPGGECIAILFPDVITPPVQADHFRYYWNGTHVSYAQQITGDRSTFALRSTA